MNPDTLKDILSAIGYILLGIPSLIMLLNNVAEKRLKNSQIRKTDEETKKLEKDAKEVEAAIAEKLLNASSELIDKYRLEFEDFTKDQIELKNTIVSIRAELEKEKALRKRKDKVIIELTKGVTILLEQLMDKDLTPKWVPDESLKKMILEDNHD